jgi:hypothetical protein
LHSSFDVVARAVVHAGHGLLALLRDACPLLCSLHSFTVMPECAVRAEGLRLPDVLLRPGASRGFYVKYFPGESWARCSAFQKSR